MSRSRGRSRFTLLLLVLTSVTLITLDFRGEGDGVVATLRDGAADALGPVRSAADAVLSPVGEALSGITGYGELEDRNAELRARIAELEGERLRNQDAEQRMVELLRLFDLYFAGDISSVAARVVSVPISNFEQTIELDRGSGEGIAIDMPVVTGDGLVGRVVSVSRSRSVVLLITDPESAVGVRLSVSGERGIAEGEGPGRPLSVGFVDVSTEILPRELVLTSGLEDSPFPGDIPVGRVAESGTEPGQLEQRVTLDPIADLDRLRVVKVLKWSPS
ncbi:MAG: rod shape-determining protein MreC [Acidimicrobiales bacterium]